MKFRRASTKTDDRSDRTAAKSSITIGAASRVVANSVEVRRTALNLSRAQLSQALLDGPGRSLTRQAIGEIEAGRRRIDVDDLVALALVLGCSPQQLLDGEEAAGAPPGPWDPPEPRRVSGFGDDDPDDGRHPQGVSQTQLDRISLI